MVNLHIVTEEERIYQMKPFVNLVFYTIYNRLISLSLFKAVPLESRSPKKGSDTQTHGLRPSTEQAAVPGHKTTDEVLSNTTWPVVFTMDKVFLRMIVRDANMSRHLATIR